MKILYSQEYWKVSGATAYAQFFEPGGGWMILPSDTLVLTWEMIDNNTVKVQVDSNGQKMNSKLDIINNNGQYSLVSEDGKTVYTPYTN